jgi:hypothetical protein
MAVLAATIKEDLLQFIWEQQLFQRHALRTTDGRTLEVIRHGGLQRDSGPDFSDARVRIDGQLLVGSIEVHVRSSEWYAHKHEKDPAYDNVILHVVLEHDMAVRTARGGRVPTLELGPRIVPQSLEVYERWMRNKAWVPCEEQVASVDPVRAELWLERVLIERLERKAAEVDALHHQLGDDAAETFFHLLLRAVGHKVNAEPFGMLAHALPLKVLLKYRDDALRTEALLFGQAGLLRTDFIDEHPRILQREHALLQRMHDLQPAPLAAWKFARLHPPNFPTVRIAQLAGLVMRSNGSFSELLASDDVEAIRDLLDVQAGEYWTEHFTFDQASAAHPKRFGRDAADHVIINAIVPFRFAMARIRRDEIGAQRALDLLERAPAEVNSIVSRWDELGLPARNAARSQALIELKNSHCSQRRCLSCGIGTELLKRTAP